MTEENRGASDDAQVDVQRFEFMVNAYRAPAMALALNVLGNREDAEDACQETFVSAYRSMAQKALPSNLKSWILTILYRRCLDIVRRRNRSFRLAQKVKTEIVLQSDNPGNSRIDPHRPFEKLSLSQSVLQGLTKKERLVLSLWANEDYSFQEIAGVLGCSPGTVRAHLFRARKKLKTMMEKGHDALPVR
jgi:RNA polymerase sigma-70 factor (ECF subfamily)